MRCGALAHCIFVQAGIITVCCGGGGIPVAVDGRGMRRGVEAVVDKDEASALLGIKLKADWLLMLTGGRAWQGTGCAADACLGGRA